MARRGLSLGSKLLLASLLLLTLPWLAWRAMVAFEAFLVDGQLRALELLASSATLLLQPQAGHLAGRVGAGSILLYAWPLDADESFDGYPGRWPEITGDGLAIGQATPGAPAGRLRLGTRDGRLYGLVTVSDPRPDYRNPGNPELATSDQLRLELHGDDGVSRYRVLAAQGPGRVDILPSTPDGERQVIGPDLGIEAVWQPGRDGYTVEFRLPLALLEQHPVLRVAVHDGDSGRDATSPPLRPRYREPALEAQLGGLDAGTARVWVVDRDRWVRASVGGPSGLGEPPARLARLALSPLDAALEGHTGSARITAGDDLLVAAAPISTAGRVVGAVVAEQGLDDLLRSRYRTFADFSVASLVLIGASALALLLFAARLAWRIRRLGREAGAAIDARGRQVSARVQAEAESGDEIGELSRVITALLARLQRHTRFVESLPRTLRHELSNPLNSVATALQNLAEETESTERDKLLERAARGLVRLEQTLAALTEAADLEEALQGDPRTRLDLARLLGVYLESFEMAHPDARLVKVLPETSAWIEGVDHRLEQLLDKLLDNAVDFTPVEGAITVTLRSDGDGWRLDVANDGPPLPESLEGKLFETLVSGRARAGGGGHHLGLGLYVVRRIAEAHGGRATATTGPDRCGVLFSVWLPRSA
ncbi:MAG: hypothetical protein GWP66_02135 [Gammaproteobacteria bacterium]|jgi:signal transduction histidine kinase|nr:hypothetical protein [Gammaproteobacteria bacterium]